MANLKLGSTTASSHKQIDGQASEMAGSADFLKLISQSPARTQFTSEWRFSPKPSPMPFSKIMQNSGHKLLGQNSSNLSIKDFHQESLLSPHPNSLTPVQSSQISGRFQLNEMNATKTLFGSDTKLRGSDAKSGSRQMLA
jgi:hypothetical protein